MTVSQLALGGRLRQVGARVAWCSPPGLSVTAGQPVWCRTTLCACLSEMISGFCLFDWWGCCRGQAVGWRGGAEGLVGAGPAQRPWHRKLHPSRFPAGLNEPCNGTLSRRQSRCPVEVACAETESICFDAHQQDGCKQVHMVSSAISFLGYDIQRSCSTACACAQTGVRVSS